MKIVDNYMLEASILKIQCRQDWSKVMNHGGVNARGEGGLISSAFQALKLWLSFGLKSKPILFIYSSTSVLSNPVNYSVKYRKNFGSYFCWYTDILIELLQNNFCFFCLKNNNGGHTLVIYDSGWIFKEI